eukprot:5317474-Amphidinium_carterae.1
MATDEQDLDYACFVQTFLYTARRWLKAQVLRSYNCWWERIAWARAQVKQSTHTAVPKVPNRT